MQSNDKITAIYELREAVETKVHAETALDQRPAADTRAAFLDATLDVEDKTQTAIDVCHSCELPHAVDERHGVVINVDFRRAAKLPAPGGDPAS